MKKSQKVLVITIASFFTLLFIGRLLGFYIFWSIPTQANEPGLKLDSYHVSSNLFSPVKNDFICFETLENGEKVTYVKRLVGVAGDKIELKNSILYVNDINVDQNMNLKRSYLISIDEYLKHQALINDPYLLENERMIKQRDSVIVQLEDAWLDGIIKARRLYDDNPNPKTFAFYGKEWSMVNFGPYIVPEEHFFVMGDSRDNSLDSRYIGPIHESKFEGVVITAKY